MNSSYKNEMSGYKPPKENYRLLSTQLNSHDKKKILKKGRNYGDWFSDVMMPDFGTRYTMKTRHVTRWKQKIYAS
jgi:hypothetical protein